MSKSGRERLDAGVTSPEFWAHPVSSLALKATGMTPYLLAAAIPGALIADGAAGYGGDDGGWRRAEYW